MYYDRILPAQMIDRPNRFIVRCLLEGEEVLAHCPNTGAMTGLIQPGGRVILQQATNPKRKTRYSLIHVEKEGAWINVDSQAPNQIYQDYLTDQPQALVGDGNQALHLQGEVTYGTSRFDFAYQVGDRQGFIEVKGVTLEEEGRASFPDAPSLRARKHVQELMQALAAGYEAKLVFVVQIPYAKSFSMNEAIDPGLADLVDQARAQGLDLLAYRCQVQPNRVEIIEKIALA